MEFLDAVFKWLRLFPGLERLQVDNLLPEVGSCGLYPVGTEQTGRREDVTGGAVVDYRTTFLLRRRLPKGAEAARWMLAFPAYVHQQSLQALTPQPGRDTRVRAEKARMVAAEHAGLATYEVQIIFTYQAKE